MSLLINNISREILTREGGFGSSPFLSGDLYGDIMRKQSILSKLKKLKTKYVVRCQDIDYLIHFSKDLSFEKVSFESKKELITEFMKELDKIIKEEERR